MLKKILIIAVFAVLISLVIAIPANSGKTPLSDAEMSVVFAGCEVCGGIGPQCDKAYGTGFCDAELGICDFEFKGTCSQVASFICSPSTMLFTCTEWSISCGTRPYIVCRRDGDDCVLDPSTMPCTGSAMMCSSNPI